VLLAPGIPYRLVVRCELIQKTCSNPCELWCGLARVLEAHFVFVAS